MRSRANPWFRSLFRERQRRLIGFAAERLVLEARAKLLTEMEWITARSMANQTTSDHSNDQVERYLLLARRDAGGGPLTIHPAPGVAVTTWAMGDW